MRCRRVMKKKKRGRRCPTEREQRGLKCVRDEGDMSDEEQSGRDGGRERQR